METLCLVNLVLSFFIHSTQANNRSITVHKICSPGRVFCDFKCANVVEGRNWTEFLYDSSTFTNFDTTINTVQVNYVLASNGLPECSRWKVFNVTQPSDIEKNEPTKSFILLNNGTLMWRSKKCTCGGCNEWRPHVSHFFIDGLGQPIPGRTDGCAYSGLESDQVVDACVVLSYNDDSLVVGVLNYTLRNDKIYAVVLFITSFIYMLTGIIYGALWNASSLPSKIIFSVVLTRALLYFLFGLAYLGKLHRWDRSASGSCTGIAVLTHYLLMTSYSWVLLLNFDLWRTFRSTKPSPDKHSSKQKYWMYSCFGWGLPFVLTLISGIVDSVYKYRYRYNYRLVPNYGNGGCFVVECAYGIYVHTFTAIFLLPALLFSFLTLNCIYQFGKQTSILRNARHGEKHSNFQMYLKLAVVMSISWTIGHIVWFFRAENDGSRSYYVRNTIFLILNWGVDLLGSSIFILLCFGCNKANVSKLEQNYQICHDALNRIRQIKKQFRGTEEPKREPDSSTPLVQIKTESTTSQN